MNKFRSVPLVVFTILVLLSFPAPSSHAQMFTNDPPPQADQTFLVERVLSADMILLANGQRVKLIGLKAPEPPPRLNVEHDEHGFVVEKISVTKTLEERAFEFARDLLEGQSVRLEFDSEKKDRELHTLAYVFLKDNIFVNAEILRQGYASLTLSPPNLKYQDALRAAYREARDERRGLSEDY